MNEEVPDPISVDLGKQSAVLTVAGGKKRILFVDDEVAVLDGIRNLLRKERKVWDMVFSSSGEAALRALESEHFDVIVSDMRMPVLDGAALLATVRERYPEVARIVLSGEAEREAVMRALPVTHHFLSKPCAAETLRATISRACELHELLADGAIRRLVGGLDRLPSLPHAYWDLIQAASNPNAGLAEIAEIAEIVERDPAMGTKVLQVVNSAYFGLPQRVAAIKQAVTYLGLELVKGLALTAHLLADDEFPAIEGFSQERLRQTSLRGASLAKRFLSSSKRADEAFAAGLVRDVGQIVLATGLPEKFGQVVREASATGQAIHKVENSLLGVTHADVGGYLLGVWGLPLPLVETVACHHVPSMAAEGGSEVLAAVHVADALIGASMTGATPAEAWIDRDFIQRAGLLPELPRWLALGEEEARKARAA